MPVLEWSETLAVGQDVMDETHREFVALLNRLGDAADADLLEHLDEFARHTEAHFRQEEAWMEQTAFPPLACHRGEHENILEVVREVRRRVSGGELHYGRTLAAALAEWFPLHAGSMDTMLAQFIAASGFQPQSGGRGAEASSHDSSPAGARCNIMAREGGCR